MATNVNSPFGFKAVRHLSGAPFTAQPVMCWVPSSDGAAIFNGDPVKKAASVLDPLSLGVPVVTVITANSDPIFGICIGTDPILGQTTPNLNIPNYRPASVGMYVYVVNSIDTVFQVQVVNGTPANTDFNKNASWKTGTGSTVNGLSASGLDQSTINTTNTLQFHILGLAPIPGNIPASANAIYEVALNTSQLGLQIAGV